jgi:hypothetical protein
LLRSAVTERGHESIAGLFDAAYGNPLQRLPQRGRKLAQKKTAVAALEPRLVVMHDDDWIAHANFIWLERPLNVSKV